MFLPNSRRSTKLLLMADEDRDGKIDLAELAQLFETVFEANLGPGEENGDGDGESSGSENPVRSTVPSGTFPQPLRALAGSLQLLPPRERAIASEAADRSALWNVGVPGDDHTLRRVILEDGGATRESKKHKQKQSNCIRCRSSRVVIKTKDCFADTWSSRSYWSFTCAC